MLIFVMIFTACFLLSLMLTAWLKNRAIANAQYDMPNARSSHTIPTPRGGGLAIVIVFLLGCVGLFSVHLLSQPLMLALVAGGLAVALVGYCDDQKSLSARIRFLVHLCVAVGVLYALHGFPYLDFGGMKIYAPYVGIALALIAIIWSINLYNFMDGIDGFAGSEGLFLSAIAGGFFVFIGDKNMAYLCAILSASIAGFLYWNWSPAKIFLGDVGSGFLGFVFIVIAIAACNKHEGSLLFWLILFSAFLLDATFTLLYRLAKKQAWYLAHRKHAYQKCVDSGWSHQKATLILLLINVAWLLPAALLQNYYPHYALWIAGFVGVSLLLLWLKARTL
jgi:Fuc2NAc and GlcNAc transferase